MASCRAEAAPKHVVATALVLAPTHAEPTQTTTATAAQVEPSPMLDRAVPAVRVCDSQWEAGYLGKLDYFNQALGMGMRGMGILKT